ncbi:hypothetical protein, partial [Shigella sonnei]|uniref:hypothetical protein n=1 Tax=Shigella sonnei TaxID=624 RepID=UPI001C0A6D68
MLVAIGGVFLLYATYHMGGSFFFATPFFCGLHPQKLHLSPPKAPPFTPKSSTFHPQKLHLSSQKHPEKNKTNKQKKKKKKQI